MSRETILSMISRIERIADMLPTASRDEQTVLLSQAGGTFTAVVAEFERSGISLENPHMDHWLRQINPNRVGDLVEGIHAIAGYCRGLALRVD